MGERKTHNRTRAQESTNAIERMYITMRYLINRGFYKPMGHSGETLRETLLALRPEIYGTVAEDKSELHGLLYVIDRLPYGIEECRYINLTSEEGYSRSHFKPIVPLKRRRNCYRIDNEQMNIEITRGRSEIYDILTHLTFLYIESHKIIRRVLIDDDGAVSRDWKVLEELVLAGKKPTAKQREVALAHTANILGRTYAEVEAVYGDFASAENPHQFLYIVYYLGKLAREELISDSMRVVTFSPVLCERLGHHIHGELWSDEVKRVLFEKDLLHRPLHIISANMHSVLNTLYAPLALPDEYGKYGKPGLFEFLSKPENSRLQKKVETRAKRSGMVFIKDKSGTNIDVQIFDATHLGLSHLTGNRLGGEPKPEGEQPVVMVMDYAFGEQAYETLDELLKPYICPTGERQFLNVASVSIMGKAGILDGARGDIMIPKAHLFEGTADNYPFKNRLKKSHFKDSGARVCTGSMITVLGTSLQNKDLLQFFHESTWSVVGIEMEGAHYQKAIQAASKIRGSISGKVNVRYAYYASDNPLKTGSTLASGGLGLTGVKPTYLITEKILNQIFN